MGSIFLSGYLYRKRGTVLPSPFLLLQFILFP